MRRVAAAAAMQPEDRRQQHRPVESQAVGWIRSPRCRPVDQESPIVDSGESVLQQHFPRSRVVRLGFGQHHARAAPPRHLDDQGTRPGGQTRPRLAGTTA